jgi:Replication-relaxation
MRPGVMLTPRDHQVLASLQRMRYLTIEQLQRLHFVSLATTRRRIRRLESAGLVQRLRSPALSVELVQPICSGSARPVRMPSPVFLRHAVEINNFRIGLSRALDHRPDLRLIGFACDRDRAVTAPGTRPRPVLACVSSRPGIGQHLPDAAFVLRRGERTGLYVIEIDRGTEVVSHVAKGVGKMVGFYLRAIADGTLAVLANALGAPQPPSLTRVLIVTTTSRRVGNIRAAWGTKPFTPEHAKRLIWLADASILQHPDLLSAPWQSLDASDESTYRIDGKSGETGR